MTSWYWVALGGLFTFGLIALGHYLPRAKEVETNERGHMLIDTSELLGRYVFGVGVIVVGFIIIQAGQGDWWQVVELLLVVAVGGLTVFGCYAWDRLVKRLRRARKYEAVDDA